MNELARALTSGSDDGLTCQACEALLADYIEAEERGQGEHPSFAAVQRHLERCPHCMRSYRELSELIAEAYGEPQPLPAPLPEFDFSFLPARQAPLAGWNQVGHFMIRLGADLWAGLENALQPPALVPGLARVKSGQADPPGETLLDVAIDDSSGDQAATITTTITVTTAPTDPTRCIMAVTVDIPSRGGWPNLADTAVTLKQGEDTLATEWTDEFGKVVFGPLERAVLPDLSLEIAPAA